jgi:hypothetical protein
MYIDALDVSIDWDSLEPDTEVFTPFGSSSLFPELGETHADCCYTSERECREHFWFKTEENTTVVHKETLKEFLNRRKDEHEMNPFCTLGKLKVLAENTRLWKD